MKNDDFLKVILAASVAYLLALVIERLNRKQKQQEKRKGQKQQNRLVPVVTALAAVLVVAATDKVETWPADPSPRVSVEQKENEILLKLEARNAVNGIGIDFPVLGRIVNVHDYNSPADAVTASKAIVGANTPESGNNVQIVLTDVKLHRPLSFKILYEPIQMKINVAGMDRWHMSYSWLHAGAMITTTKWYLIANGKEVGPPPVQVKGLVVYPRALSPEEIKKDYQQGAPRTLLK